ncbi:hypothetical protein OL229_21285 [Neisseriaceae bacterium JH1-16]|nr:hypothetical protein [Neisseriaceae bacterium JH1-16]
MTHSRRITRTASLDLAAIVAEQLLSRRDGLPGTGVRYGEAGRGKTLACSTLARDTHGY